MNADPAGWALVNPNRTGYSVIEATNWYAYVSNSPVKYVDPTSEVSWVVNEQGQYIGDGEHYTSPAIYANLNFSRKGDSKYWDATGDHSGLTFIDEETGLEARYYKNEVGDHVLALIA